MMLENLRYLAGVLFWALADLFLGLAWVGIIGVIIWTIIKGSSGDD